MDQYDDMQNIADVLNINDGILVLGYNLYYYGSDEGVYNDLWDYIINQDTDEVNDMIDEMKTPQLRDLKVKLQVRCRYTVPEMKNGIKEIIHELNQEYYHPSSQSNLQ